MVHGTANASHGEATEARELLVALLTQAYGSAHDAQAALDRALVDAARTELPPGGPELLAFVRAHLLPILSAAVGPRLTMAMLDDFVAKHEARSGERSSKDRPLGVVVVDPDRVGRPALARALLRAGCHVTVVDCTADLDELASWGGTVDVAVVDVTHPGRLVLLEAIVDRFPQARLVARSDAGASTQDLLQSLGVARFEVVPRDVPVRALIDGVLRALLG